MANTDTRILSFGDAAGESGLAAFIVDPTRNLDRAGNVRSSFPPGTEVWLLLHLGPELELVRVVHTAGSLELIGWTTAAATAEISLGYAGAAMELPQYPLAMPVASWYGRQATLTLDGRTVTVSSGPVRGVLSYNYRARLYRFRPPPLQLTSDQRYPVVAWAETRKVA